MSEPISPSEWAAQEKWERQQLIDQLVEHGAERDHLESLSLWDFIGVAAMHAECTQIDMEPWRNAMKACKRL